MDILFIAYLKRGGRPSIGPSPASKEFHFTGYPLVFFLSAKEAMYADPS